MTDNDTSKRRRAGRAVRAEEIIKAALTLAGEHGYTVVTREQIAEAAKCSSSLVGKYFGEMGEMRSHIMRAAVDYANAEVVLQGLVTKHPLALAASEELKNACARVLYDTSGAQLSDLEA